MGPCQGATIVEAVVSEEDAAKLAGLNRSVFESSARRIRLRCRAASFHMLRLEGRRRPESAIRSHSPNGQDPRDQEQGDGRDDDDHGPTDFEVVAGLVAAGAEDHQVRLVADRRDEAHRRGQGDAITKGRGLRPLAAAMATPSGKSIAATATLVINSVKHNATTYSTASRT